jgi:hypothetical protein
VSAAKARAQPVLLGAPQGLRSPLSSSFWLRLVGPAEPAALVARKRAQVWLKTRTRLASPACCRWPRRCAAA